MPENFIPSDQAVQFLIGSKAPTWDIGELQYEEFIAYLSAVTLSGSVWYYTWTEQSFNPSTGAFLDLDGGRSGDSTSNLMVERNNNFTAVPCYVLARQKGSVAGDLVYDFFGEPTPVSTAASITSDQNNYDPGAASILDLSTDALRNITGFSGGTPGRELTVTNTGSNPLVLSNQSGSSTAANRVITGVPTGASGDYTLAPGQSANLTYDGTASRWRLDSSTAGAVNTQAVTPAQITSAQNDYTTSGYGTLYLSSDASRTITGFGGGYDGRVVEVINVGSNSIVIADNNSGSTAANRVKTGFAADFTLATGQALALVYDGANTIWRLLATTAGIGGVGGVTGSGTNTFLTRWTSASTIGNSILDETAHGVDITTASTTVGLTFVSNMVGIFTPSNELDIKFSAGNGFVAAFRDTDGIMTVDNTAHTAAYAVVRSGTLTGVDTTIAGGGTVKGGIVVNAVTTTGSGAAVQGTSPTVTDLVANQAANGDNAITSTRATDTSPTGNFLVFKNAAGTTVFAVDITGTITTGSLSAARITSGTLSQARGGTGKDTSAATDGQLLIGKTSDNSLNLATLTAGTGVSITNGAGSISIAATGTGGTVTSITAGTGLTGGTITGSGTISLTTPVSQANGGTGKDTSAATDGQILIGKTSDHSLNLATLTAGTGVTVTNGAGSISIATTGAPPTGSAGGDLTGTYPNPTIDTGKVTTAKIADANVTYAKIQNVTNARLLGNNSGGAAAPSEISLIANQLAFTSATLGISNTFVANRTTADPSTTDYVLGDQSGNVKFQNTELLGLLRIHPGGRLTGSTGTPVPVTVSNFTTLYYTPYLHDCIVLWTGTVWDLFQFTEVSIALGTMTANLPYDIFCFVSGSTVTLEKLAWSSFSVRATAITIQDGRYCKSGDKTRLYLGTVCPTTTTQVQDTTSIRYLWNMYNRVLRYMVVQDTTNSWTYTTTTWQAANANSANAVQVLVGLEEDCFSANVKVQASNSTGCNLAVGVGIDSTTVNSALLYGGAALAAVTAPVVATYEGLLAPGTHTITWLEISQAVGTTTWFGDAGLTYWQSGLSARFLM